MVEEDPLVLERRVKQIEYEKASLGYKIYSELIKKPDRFASFTHFYLISVSN